MNRLTEPLRQEHQELYPHILQLKDAADLIGGADASRLAGALSEAREFLHGHLLPHAQAEDAALYPVVARVLGSPQATATMQADHAAVQRLITELDEYAGNSGPAANPAEENDLRRVLYGLFTLVSVHFSKEEEVYLPLLDARLTPAEADEMFERLEEASAQAHRAVHA